MIDRWRFMTLCLFLAATGLYVHLHSDVTVPLNKPFIQFPTVLNGWRMVSEEAFSEQTLAMLKPTDYLYRTYLGEDGKEAQLYIGYHGGGENNGEIHSPKNCLPGSGWYEATSRKLQLDVGKNRINLVTAVYQKGDAKVLFYYWYQVRDRSLSDEYSLKLAEIVNSMTARRRDAAFVRISLPVNRDEEQSAATAIRFIHDFYPVITGFLPS